MALREPESTAERVGSPAQRGGGQRRRLQNWWLHNQKRLIPYIFIAPNVIVFTVFMFIPILFAIYISLTRWSLIGGSPEFVGLRNYITMFTSITFWQAFYNTIVYTVGSVPISIALGLLVAIGLNRKMPGRALLRGVYFAPFVVSMVAVALTGQWMFNDSYGVINNMLNALGIGSIPWLSSASWAMPSLIFVTYWIRIGFSMIVYLAALQGIPTDVYEAARMDGATSWKRFRHITWPLLRPTTFLLLILNIVYSLYVFDLIYVMTAGGPGFSTTVIVQYLFQQGFQQGNVGYASAMGVFLYVGLLVFTLFQWRVTGQAEDNA